MTIITLHTIDTEYSADSVEWCSYDEPNSKYFACGTYQLDKTADGESEAGATKGGRKGRIYLFKFDTEHETLDRNQSIETAAILDMKWLPSVQDGSGPLLATANSIGEIELYELSQSEHQLERCAQIALDNEQDPPPLALAFDWQQESSTGFQIIVSDSLGKLSLLTYGPEGGVSKQREWSAHGFEAWTCVFDRWNPHVAYSGGDDGLLLGHDLRAESRMWTNKAHMAGVTCLLSHPKNEHQLVTGSYDEKLRLFDTRSMKSTLSEVDLGGGIWRIKPHPLRTDLLLVACMYKNFSIVSMAEKELSLLETYGEHESICYGADWAPNIGQSPERHQMMHMATCSFYDHKLCLSRVEIDDVK